MKYIKIILVALLLSSGLSVVQASDIQVSEGKVMIEEDQVFIEFQVSWKLSWHNNRNWDAAWVFAKDPSNGFRHLKLINDSGALIENHFPDQPDPGFDVSDDQLGAFIYRKQQRSERGSNNWTVRLEWDYSSSDYEIEDLPESVEMYAVEMVYVPEGPFESGDPQGIKGPPNAFFSLSDDSSGTYKVENSGAIPVCSAPGSLCYDSGGGDQQGPVPADYPNGYDAFYLMKYKVTQGQYATMLNTLSGTQTSNRGIHASLEYRDVRGSIIIKDGKYIAEHPDRACGFLGWRDGSAFADWAALRPYTELEYEKAARGTIPAVTNEYAWGSTNIMHGDTLFNPSGIMADREDGDEYIRGNANYRPQDRDFSIREELVFIGGDGGLGPLRVDIFETRAHLFNEPSIREASGAGYYGALGLTGGLFERMVTIGSERGRSFTGTHGDGSLSYSGLAANIVDDWPNRSGEGLALRARNFAFDSRFLQMANRSFGEYSATYRASGMGFRAARTANN